MTKKATKPTAAERVATLLRKQIAGGTYRVGEKLPSIRTLATEMSVSKNCVVEAFELLAASGEVEPQRGSGHYVSATACSGAYGTRAAHLRQAPGHRLADARAAQ